MLFPLRQLRLCQGFCGGHAAAHAAPAGQRPPAPGRAEAKSGERSEKAQGGGG